MTEDECKIRERDPDEIAQSIASELDTETKNEIVEWAIRAGLGPLYLKQTEGRDFSPETLGNLLSIRFEPQTDLMHHKVADTINEWQRTCEIRRDRGIEFWD